MMLAASLRASSAIARRDLRMFMASRTAVATQALSLLMTMSLFYFMSRLVSVERFGSQDEYFAYVAVGLIIFSVMYSTFGLTEAVRAELLSGSFERLLISPFGPVLGVVSMTLFPLARALLMAVWAVVAAAFVFSLDLQWSTAPLALPIGALAAVAFSAVALAVAAIVIAFKHAPGLGFIVAGIALVSGLYFPTDLLPIWMRWLAEVQPFTPAVILLRHVLVGLPAPDPAWIYLLKLVGFAAVLVPLSAWLMDRAVARGQRRGTILEY
jgi:ABC-2 type transport system permease protein